MAKNQKINLKDKVEDGEMDLSMLDLQDVPVKDIASYKKVYSLDLSNNNLVQLPKNFPTLTNIMKLDLSKNKLKSLPENFGDLTKLKHLDLYKNELQHLPLTFSNLKNLRWLDLKDNPLVPAIKDAAGQCLDSKQCTECAANITLFYTKLQEKIEEERSMRDKQRQKDKQANDVANAQKAKQEKKIKKKEKNKPTEGPKTTQQDDIETVKVIEEEMGEEKNSKSTRVLPYLFTLLLLTFTTLFLLTAVKFEKTVYLEESVVRYWNMCLEKAPPFLQDFGNKTGSMIRNVHEQLGQYMFQLEKCDHYIYFVNKIKYLFQFILSDRTN